MFRFYATDEGQKNASGRGNVDEKLYFLKKYDSQYNMYEAPDRISWLRLSTG
jgi:hypothetical protein